MALSAYDVRFILSVQDRTGNSLRRVAGDMRQMGAEATRMRRAFAMMDVGRGLQMRGVLGGAALGAAAQQAADFNSQVTKAATQIQGNNSVEKIGNNTVRLHNEILGLMKLFPATAGQQADAAYDIFSAMNVPLEKGVGLLKLFNMVSVAGATDLNTASNAMITILNNFGGSWKQTMDAVNTSFAIIRFGRLEFSEFNDMLNSVVPSAKASGQSLQDVAGAMAFVTKMIPSQKQGATAISRLLEVLSRPDFRRGAERLGLTIEDMSGRLLPLPKIIGELARLDISQAESTINSLFQVVTATGRGGGRGIESTVQARRALILLVKEYRQYMDTQRGVTAATSEFEKRYTLMIGSAGVKWERFKAQLQALLIMVGTQAIPWFERLGEIVENGIDWVKQNRDLITTAAKWTFLISVGSILAGTFLKMAATAMILHTGIGRLVGFFTGLRSAGALASRVMVSAAASFLMLRAGGLKALPAVLGLWSGLAKIAKLGVITTGLILVWQIRKSEGAQNFFKDLDDALIGAGKFLQKGRMPGATQLGMGLEAIASLDKKVRVENLRKMKLNAKRKPGSNDDIAKVASSNVKDLLKQIERDTKGLFNSKMMRDLEVDAGALTDKINDLINPETSKTRRAADAKAKAAEITNRTQELMKQASDNLMNIYDQFKQANETAFGSIFEPIGGQGEEEQLRKAWNWTSGSGDLLSTMKARLKQFRDWRNSLNGLLKKGFSSEFVDQIRALGPEEGLKHMKELNAAGPRRVKEFNRVMAAGKAEITKATEIDFKTQLNKWEKFGADTAFRIAAGLESEEQGLQNRMVGVVERTWGAVARTIATQQINLEHAMRAAAESAATDGLPKFKLFPKMVQPKDITQAAINAAGINGRYAIPSAATGGLPIAAVQALGDRNNAMARAYLQRPQGAVTNIFQVDGTFLTPEEMMDAALRKSAQKVKNKR